MKIALASPPFPASISDGLYWLEKTVIDAAKERVGLPRILPLTSILPRPPAYWPKGLRMPFIRRYNNKIQYIRVLLLR